MAKAKDTGLALYHVYQGTADGTSPHGRSRVQGEKPQKIGSLVVMTAHADGSSHITVQERHQHHTVAYDVMLPAIYQLLGALTSPTPSQETSLRCLLRWQGGRLWTYVNAPLSPTVGAPPFPACGVSLGKTGFGLGLASAEQATD